MDPENRVQFELEAIDKVTEVIARIKAGLAGLGGTFKSQADAATRAFEPAMASVSKSAQAAGQAVSQAFDQFPAQARAAVTAVSSQFATIVSDGQQAFRALTAAVDSTWAALGAGATALGTQIQNAWQSLSAQPFKTLAAAGLTALASLVDGAANVWSQITAQAKATGATLASAFSGLTGASFTSMATAAGQAWTAIRAGAAQTGDVITRAFEALTGTSFSGIAAAATQAWDTITAGAVTARDAIGAALSSFAADPFGALSTAAASAWETITAGASSVSDAIVAAFAAFQDSPFAALSDAASAAWDAITAGASAAGSAITEALSNLSASAFGQLTDAASAAWGTITAGAASVGAFIQDAFDGLGIDTFFDNIQASADAAWEAISGAAQDTAGNISEWFSQAWDQVTSGAADLPTQVGSAFGTLSDDLDQFFGDDTTFSDLLGDAWDTLSNAAQSALSAVGAAATSAGTVLQSALNVDATKVFGSLSDVATQTWTSVRESATGAWDGITTAVGTSIRNLTTLFTGFNDGAGKSTSSVAEKLQAQSLAFERSRQAAVAHAQQMRATQEQLTNELQQVNDKIRELEAASASGYQPTIQALAAARQEAEQLKDVINRLNGAIQDEDNAAKTAAKSSDDMSAAAKKANDEAGKQVGIVDSLANSFMKMAAAVFTGNAAWDITKGILLGLWHQVTGLVEAFPHLIEHVAHVADEFWVMSKQTGVSADALSKFDYVASQTGTSLGTITTSIFMMSRTLGAASGQTEAAVSQLGLSLDQLRSQSPEESFQHILSGLNALPAQADRARIGMELFGRQFRSMSQLVGQDIDGMMKKAEEMGLVITDRMAEAGNAFTDAFDTLGRVTEGFTRQIGVTFLPAVTKAVSGMADAIGEVLSSIRFDFSGWYEQADAAATAFVAAFKDMAEALQPFIKAVIDIVAAMVPILSGAFTAVMKAISALSPVIAAVASVLSTFAVPIAVVTVAITGYVTALTLAKVAQLAYGLAAKGLSVVMGESALAQGAQTAATWLQTAATGALTVATDLATAAMTGLLAVEAGTGIAEVIIAVVALGAALVALYKYWDTLTGAVSTAIGWIRDKAVAAFTTLWKAITTNPLVTLVKTIGELVLRIAGWGFIAAGVAAWATLKGAVLLVEGVFGLVGKAIQVVWDLFGSPILTGVVTTFTFLGNLVKGPVVAAFSLLGQVVTVIADKIQWILDHIPKLPDLPAAPAFLGGGATDPNAAAFKSAREQAEAAAKTRKADSEAAKALAADATKRAQAGELNIELQAEMDRQIQQYLKDGLQLDQLPPILQRIHNGQLAIAQATKEAKQAQDDQNATVEMLKRNTDYQNTLVDITRRGEDAQLQIIENNKQKELAILDGKFAESARATDAYRSARAKIETDAEKAVLNITRQNADAHAKVQDDIAKNRLQAAQRGAAGELAAIRQSADQQVAELKRQQTAIDPNSQAWKDRAQKINDIQAKAASDISLKLAQLARESGDKIEDIDRDIADSRVKIQQQGFDAEITAMRQATEKQLVELKRRNLGAVQEAAEAAAIRRKLDNDIQIKLEQAHKAEADKAAELAAAEQATLIKYATDGAHQQIELLDNEWRTRIAKEQQGYDQTVEGRQAWQERRAAIDREFANKRHDIELQEKKKTDRDVENAEATHESAMHELYLQGTAAEIQSLNDRQAAELRVFEKYTAPALATEEARRKQRNAILQRQNDEQLQLQIKHEQDVATEVYSIDQELGRMQMDLRYTGVQAALAANQQELEDHLRTIELTKNADQRLMDATVALYRAKAEAIIRANDPIWKAWQDLNRDMRDEWASTWEQVLSGEKDWTEAMLQPFKDVQDSFKKMIAGIIADWQQELMAPMMDMVKNTMRGLLGLGPKKLTGAAALDDAAQKVGEASAKLEQSAFHAGGASQQMAKSAQEVMAGGDALKTGGKAVEDSAKAFQMAQVDAGKALDASATALSNAAADLSAAAAHLATSPLPAGFQSREGMVPGVSDVSEILGGLTGNDESDIADAIDDLSNEVGISTEALDGSMESTNALSSALSDSTDATHTLAAQNSKLSAGFSIVGSLMGGMNQVMRFITSGGQMPAGMPLPAQMFGGGAMMQLPGQLPGIGGAVPLGGLPPIGGGGGANTLWSHIPWLGKFMQPMIGGTPASQFTGPLQEGQTAMPSMGMQRAGGAMMAAGGIAQLFTAQGKLANTMAGMQAGAGIGQMIMPGIGTAIGAGVGALAGFIKGALQKPEFKKAMKDVGRDWGVTISEETGKAIEKTEKDEKVSRGTATLMHLQDIIHDAGGLKADNVEMFHGKLHDLFSEFDRGKLTADQLTKAMQENLQTFVKYGETDPKGLSAFYDAASLMVAKFKEGKISAEQASTALEDGIGKIAAKAVKDNSIVSQSFLDMAKSAKDAGLQLDSVKQFNDAMMTKLAGGVKNLTTGFGETLKEGLHAALKDLPERFGDEWTDKIYGALGKDSHLNDALKEFGDAIKGVNKDAQSEYLDEFGHDVVTVGEASADATKKAEGLNERFRAQQTAVADAEQAVKYYDAELARATAAHKDPLALQRLQKELDNAKNRLNAAKGALATLADEYTKAQAAVDKSKQHVTREATGGPGALDPKAEQAKVEQALAEIRSKFQTEFDRISRITLASFNAMIANGKSMVEAIDANADGIDQLTTAADKFGLHGNAAFDQLKRWRQLTIDNKGLIDSVGGLNDVMVALANTGSLDADTFEDIQKQVTDSIEGEKGAYQQMTEHGFTAREAEEALKPTLESIIKAHKERGLAIDEETQKLIDQATQDGVLKKEQISTNDILMQGLTALITAVGGTLPEAWQKAADAAKNGTNDMKQHVGAAAQGAADAYNAMGSKIHDYMQSAFGGLDVDIDGFTQKLVRAASVSPEAFDKAMGEIKDTITDKLGDGSSDAAQQVLANLGSVDSAFAKLRTFLDQSSQQFDQWASQAGQAADDVGDKVDRVNFGSSPGGLKEIPLLLGHATAAITAFAGHATKHFDIVKDSVDAIHGPDLSKATTDVTQLGGKITDLFKAKPESQRLTEFVKDLNAAKDALGTRIGQLQAGADLTLGEKMLNKGNRDKTIAGLQTKQADISDTQSGLLSDLTKQLSTGLAALQQVQQATPKELAKLLGPTADFMKPDKLQQAGADLAAGLTAKIKEIQSAITVTKESMGVKPDQPTGAEAGVLADLNKQLSIGVETLARVQEATPKDLAKMLGPMADFMKPDQLQKAGADLAAGLTDKIKELRATIDATKQAMGLRPDQPTDVAVKTAVEQPPDTRPRAREMPPLPEGTTDADREAYVKAFHDMLVATQEEAQQSSDTIAKVMGDKFTAVIPDAMQTTVTAMGMVTDHAGSAFQNLGDDAQASIQAILDRMQQTNTGFAGMHTNLVKAATDFQQWSNVAVSSTGAVQSAIDGVNFGSSPGGLKEIPRLLSKATGSMGGFATHAVRQMATVRGSVDAIQSPSLAPLPDIAHRVLPGLSAVRQQALGAATDTSQFGDQFAAAMHTTAVAASNLKMPTEQLNGWMSSLGAVIDQLHMATDASGSFSTAVAQQMGTTKDAVDQTGAATAAMSDRLKDLDTSQLAPEDQAQVDLNIQNWVAEQQRMTDQMTAAFSPQAIQSAIANKVVPPMETLAPETIQSLVQSMKGMLNTPDTMRAAVQPGYAIVPKEDRPLPGLPVESPKEEFQLHFNINALETSNLQEAIDRKILPGIIDALQRGRELGSFLNLIPPTKD